MRLGRIIVALLTPLVSLPALAAGSVPSPIPSAPTADSLLNLLRSVVPLAASAADSGAHAQVHSPGLAYPALAPFLAVNFAATWPPATQAAIRLLTRQHYHAQLRC